MIHTEEENQSPNRIVLLLAAAITICFRFILPGRLPLTDFEAINALQALNIAGGEVLKGGNDASYTLFTTIWFFLFGASNFTARLMPALCGTAIALAPWLFRRQLGVRPALLLTFLLGLDASLVAASRQASGLSWAALFLSLALWAFINRKSALAGVFAALAILGGLYFWQGFIGMAVAGLLYRFVFGPQSPASEDCNIQNYKPITRFRWNVWAAWFLGTLFILGTLLLLIPNGISVAASGLVSYFSGWGSQTQSPVSVLVLGLVVYQPLGLIFGISAAIYAIRKKERLGLFLTVWWLTSLVLVLIYPARQPTDLVWPALPMLALVGREIIRLVKVSIPNRWIATAEAFLVIIFLGYGWLNLIAYLRPEGNDSSGAVGLVTILIPIFIILGVFLAAREWWDKETAGQGVLWGGLAALTVWGFSAAWGSAGLGANPAGQIWYSGPMLDEVELLESTASNLSIWNMREPGQLELIVAGVDSPGLRWALRDYEQAQFLTSISPSSAPAMVITPEQPSPGLAETYRGQDFVLQLEPIWPELTFREWLEWAAFKTVPAIRSNVVLWVRTDLFPDAEGFKPGD